MDEPIDEPIDKPLDVPGQTLSDEELDRLARKLFAEVRAESPEAKAGRALESAGAVAGEVLPGIPDWLLDADDDAGDGDSGH
jgi:hypothetical protein